MGYIDKLDATSQYGGTVIEEKRRGKGFGNFVGFRCGLPIFDGGREAVIRPTTGEVVGYSGSVQIGFDKGGASSGFYRRVVNNFSEHSERLLKEGCWQNFLADIGSAGLKSAVLAGAAGGLLEWFDYSPETSLTGAAAGVAVGGLSLVRKRWRRRKKIKELSGALSRMDKINISVNLLAPDSLIGSSVGDRQAYSIGEVPVDQQQRFDSFWDQADKILGEYGFTEWQGYRTAGMPELIRRILEDVHNDCDLYDNHREKVGPAILGFARRRSDAIKSIEKYQKKLKTTNEARELRQEHRVRLSGLENLDKLATVQIKQIDQECTEAFRELIENIKEIGAEAKKDFMEAKKESIQDLLVSIYGGKSSLQGYFWGELSRVLAENSIDPSDEVVTEPAQFIVDISGMKLGYNDKIPPKHRVEMLYEAFYGLYSERYVGMLSPEEFIDKLSKDGVWSPLRRYRLGKL